MTNPIEKAINKLGSQAALAKKCNVAQQTISKWLKKGSVPFCSVELVVKATSGEIPAEDLCPKIKKLISKNSHN